MQSIVTTVGIVKLLYRGDPVTALLRGHFADLTVLTMVTVFFEGILVTLSVALWRACAAILSVDRARSSNVLDEEVRLLQRGYVPVRLLRPVSDGEYELDDWLDEATGGDPAEQLRLSRLINPYRQRIARFNLPYLELGAGTDKAVVLDVFVKMNTRSVRLTPFDIVFAEVEAEAGESLHDHVASLNE